MGIVDVFASANRIVLNLKAIGGTRMASKYVATRAAPRNIAEEEEKSRTEATVVTELLTDLARDKFSGLIFAESEPILGFLMYAVGSNRAGPTS